MGTRCYDEEKKVEKLSMGVFAARSSMLSPGESVQRAVDCGFDHVYLMINDHSAKRREMEFETYPESNIRDFFQLASKHGIAVTPISWIMPSMLYVEGLLDYMGELKRLWGCDTLWLDAEEPWTQYAGTRYDTRVSKMLQESEFKVGVSAIGYVPRSVKPLIDIADYHGPQAYTTSTSGIKPGEGQQRVLGFWQKVHGLKPTVVGLAGYRQNFSSIGLSPRQALKKAVVQSINMGYTCFSYWSLRHIKGSTFDTLKQIIEEVRNGDYEY